MVGVWSNALYSNRFVKGDTYMKYYGKEKCRILKEIRAEIARQNDIEWVVSECKHQGNCKGTCPKCEQEVRELEAALAKREALGKSVAVVGISASIALAVTGCVNPFPQPTDGVPAVDGELLPETTAAETFEMPHWKEFLVSLGLTGDYEGIGNCVLGYADCDLPAAPARKEGRVYYV